MDLIIGRTMQEAQTYARRHGLPYTLCIPALRGQVRGAVQGLELGDHDAVHWVSGWSRDLSSERAQRIRDEVQLRCRGDVRMINEIPEEMEYSG